MFDMYRIIYMIHYVNVVSWDVGYVPPEHRPWNKEATDWWKVRSMKKTLNCRTKEVHNTLKWKHDTGVIVINHLEGKIPIFPCYGESENMKTTKTTKVQSNLQEKHPMNMSS